MSAQCPKTLVQPHTHLWHHLEKLHYKTCCPTAQERYCTQRLPVKEVVQALTLRVLLRRMFGLRVEVSWNTDRDSSRGRGDVRNEDKEPRDNMDPLLSSGTRSGEPKSND